MRKLILSVIASLLVVFGLGLFISLASPQQQGTAPRYPKGSTLDVLGGYEMPDPKWPQWAHPYPKPGYIWGSQPGVFPESADRVYFANRGQQKLPDPKFLPKNFYGNWGVFSSAVSQSIAEADMVNIIVVGDRNGKAIETWNQWDKLFLWGRGPHSIHINPYDPERHVWVVNDPEHCIFQFTRDGKQLVKTLGVCDEFTGDNEDLQHLWRPTVMDFAPDGSIYVADGYKNSRIMKYDKNGRPVMKFGSPGRGHGQFDTIHGIAIGGFPQRIFVADMGVRCNGPNSGCVGRIQVFDMNGKFLDEWSGFNAYNLLMSADNHLWVFDWKTNKAFKLDLDGNLEYSFLQEGTEPGEVFSVHQMSADVDGNLYMAEAGGGRTQKFVPKRGADPTKIVWGRPLAPMTGRGSN